MYTYQVGISAQEHDAFVKESNQTNLLQSSNWAKIKDNWGNDRLGFYKDGKLLAVASVLVQPLPLGFTLIYIPRGPIMDYNDKDLVNFVIKSLKKYGKTKRALFIKFDPSLFLKQTNLSDKEAKSDDNFETLSIIETLTQVGAQWVGRTTDIAENIQPRYQANIYSKDFDFDSLPKKTKQSIKQSRNRGVVVEFGGAEFLPDFAELMKKTESRKGIHLRGLDYYQKLLATYPDDSYVTMAFLNLSERIAKLETQKDKCLTEKASFTEKTRQSKVDNNAKELERLEEEIAFLTSKLSQKGDKVPLAATISLNFGNTSENIYAGMDDDFKRYLPAINVWYETANHAFEKGIEWQNMGGVENDLSGGLYNFKSKFNPTIEEFIGEFNIPVNPILYRLSNLAYSIRKKLRSKH